MLRKLGATVALTGGLVGGGMSPADADPVDEILAVVPSSCTTTFVGNEVNIVLTNGPEVDIDPPFVFIKLPNVFNIVNGTTGATVAYVVCIL